MKKILLSVILSGCALALMAQTGDALSATLQNGESTQVFYGVDALKLAYAASEDGATITLSSGTFTNPGTIEHGIRIYGAGFENDTETGITPTKILGDFYAFNEDGISDIYLEGVWVEKAIVIGNYYTASTLNSLAVIKCYAIDVNFTNTDIASARISNCLIEGTIYSYSNTGKADNLLVQNSYIRNKVGTFKGGGNVLVDHCFIAGYQDHGPHVFRNSILYASAIGAGGSAESCIGIKDGYYTSTGDVQPFRLVNAVNCVILDKTEWPALFTDAFAEGNRNYLDSEGNPHTFTLAESEKYVGTDGTQIGINGGTYPWNKIPSTPRIVSSNIAPETDANGKLSISFKAEARPVVP